MRSHTLKDIQGGTFPQRLSQQTAAVAGNVVASKTGEGEYSRKMSGCFVNRKFGAPQAPESNELWKRFAHHSNMLGSRKRMRQPCVTTGMVNRRNRGKVERVWLVVPYFNTSRFIDGPWERLRLQKQKENHQFIFILDRCPPARKAAVTDFLDVSCECSAPAEG